MKKAPIPLNEHERLEKLLSYQVLDTRAEEAFDVITKLAASICETKTSLVSLVDQDRQWFKSKFGLSAEQTPRDISYCGHAIMGEEIFIVEDAKEDQRFCDNPLLLNEPHVRFYAGAPLVSSDGYKLGTLCVIDDQPKVLSPLQQNQLKLLAQNVVHLLEMRKTNHEFTLSSQQFADIQHLTKSGAWILDVVTGKTIWSEGIYAIYGIELATPTDKIQGLSYYAEEDQDRLVALIEKAINSKESFDAIFEFYDRFNKKKWVRSIGRPVVSAQGKVDQIVGTFQDVTEEVEKNNQLELILNSVSEGYFDWKMAEDYEYMSPRFWEILGYRPEDKLHHPSEWQKLVHPDDLQTALINFDLHVKTKGEHPFCLDVRYLHANGEYVWVKCEGTVKEWAPDGSPLRMVGTHQNINQEKIRIKRSLDLEKGIDAYALVAHTDTQGLITYVNENFCHLSQYTQADLLGKDHRLLKSGHHPKDFFREMWDTILKNKIWRGELKNCAKDGSYYWVDTTIVPMTDIEGRVSGFISFGYDVTLRNMNSHRLFEVNNILTVEQNILRISAIPLALTEKLNQALTEILSLSWLNIQGQGAIFLKKENEERLEMIVQHNLSAPLLTLCKSVDYGHCLCGRAAKERKTIHVGCVDEKHENTFEGIKPHGHYNVPFFYGEELLGVVVLYLPHGHERNEEEIGHLERIANSLGVLVQTAQNTDLLERAQQKFEMALTGAQMGIWEWDIEKKSVLFDERAAEILGLGAEEIELSFEQWSSMVHQDDIGQCLQELDDFSKGKSEKYENVHRIKRPDGQEYFILDKGRGTETDQFGKMIKMAGTYLNVSDIYQKQMELKRLAVQLDMAMEGANLGIWDWDLESNQVFFNPYWARQKGLESIELKMDITDWSTRVHPEDLDGALKLLEDYRLGHTEEYECIHRTKHKDGHWLYIIGRGKYSEWDAHGNPTRLTGTDYDITELMVGKKNLEELNNQFMQVNQKLEAVFKFSPVVVYECEINKNWTMSFINSHVEQMTGYKPEEIIHDKHISFGELIHPDDRDYVSQEVHEAIKSQKTHDITYRIVHRNNSIRWVWERGVRSPNTDRLVGVLFDVTEKRRKEDVLLLISQTRSRFIELRTDRKIFFEYLLARVIEVTGSEYGFIGEILTDKTGKFLKTYALRDISWNEETRDFYRNQAPMGLEFRNLNTLFGEVIKTERLLITNDALNHPASAGIPEGHPALNSFMGIPLLTNNLMKGMVGVANSATGYQKEDYDILAPFFELCSELIEAINLNEKFEQQRSIALHRSKLASIGELAAGVGHEINNPLAIIDGQIEFMKKHLEKSQKMDDVLSNRIDKSLKAISRISNIVKGLRAFSRSDEGELSDIDLADLIYETCDMLAEIYLSDQIEIVAKIEQSVFLKGNRGRLQQVLVNLLNNARDAIRESVDKVITVSLKKENNFVKILVSDNGPSISTELEQKIFDPFFTTKEVNQGTGIGLALVVSIVKEHSGEVSLDRTHSSGATFVISLPITTNTEIKRQEKNQTLDHEEVELRGHVLIVDDEEGIRELLKDLFEDWGLKVTTANSGQDALEIFRVHKQSLSLIISDIQMPLMNGIELFQLLRSREKYQGSFLFITGGQQHEVSQYLQEADGILTKPFEKNEIFRIVKLMLEKNGAMR